MADPRGQAAILAGALAVAAVVAVLVTGGVRLFMSADRAIAVDDAARRERIAAGVVTDDADAAGDVTLDGPCTVDEWGRSTARGRAVNRSGRVDVNYVVAVAWEVGPVQVGSGGALVLNVKPGQTAMFDVGASPTSPGSSCRVVDVTRYPSDL